MISFENINVLTTRFCFWIVTSSALIFMIVLTASTVGVAAAASSIDKVQSGLVTSDSLTTGDTSSWTFGGTATIHDVYEDSQGLHIGIRSPQSGQWVYYHAQRQQPNAQLFHSTVTIQDDVVSDGVSDLGLYVVGSDFIPNVSCAAYADWSGYYWTVGRSSNAGQTYEILYISGPNKRPQTQDCTIITNGDNYLKVYLGGELVFSSTTMNLGMSAPFIAAFNDDTSSSNSSHYAIYRDYYATKDENIKVINNPSNAATVHVVNSLGQILSNSTVSNGVATLDVGKYRFPISATINVYDSNNSVIASSPASIYGGDVFSILTTVSQPPTGLTASAISSSQINLSWNVPTNNGGSPITGYMIQRSTDSGATWSTVVSNTANTNATYSDTALAASTTYSYRVSAINAVGTSSPSNMATAVTSANKPPAAVNDSAATNTNTPITINVLANDSDPDGDTLSIISTTTPASGTLSINVNNTLTYTPNQGFVGTDSFSYTITDGKGKFASATVTITITSGNSPPVASNDSVQKPEFFSAQSIVDSLDFARFKQTIQNITSFGPRQQGTQTNVVVLNWLEGQLTSMGYDVNRHNFTFNGEPRQSIYVTKIGATKPNQMYIISAHMDSVFGTEAADDNGSGMSLLLEIARAFAKPGIKTDTSVRFIFFNNEETSLAGSIAYVQDRVPLQGIESPPESGLYPEPTWLGHITHDMILYDHGMPPQQAQSPAADIDIEFRGDAAKSAEGSSLAKFIQSANSKYSVTYPAEIGPLMCCTDTWPFRDHTATISIRENRAFEITLNGSNPHWDKPSDVFSAYLDADFQLGFDTVRMTAGGAAELAGTIAPITISVLANDSDPDGDTLSVTSTSTPTRGTTSINADNTITYTPNQKFVGTDSFTYTASDGNGGTATSTVTVTITAINDPPIAADDSATTNEDVSVIVSVLANDSDPDGDTISLDSFNATSQFNGVITRDNNGTPQDQSDDRLLYTPPSNGFGTDAFRYTISDGNGELASATVTVVVTPVNDPPIANNDSSQTDMNIPVVINVLANDSDIDGSNLSVTSTTTPTSGTATINANNTITYTPNQSFFGTDSFTYTASDGNGGTDTAAVTVMVFNPTANNPPTAANDSAQTQMSTSVTINVLANDSDPDGDTISLDSFNATSQFNGVITRDNNGTPQNLSDDRVVYTPPADGFGADTFRYTISDGNGGLASATVTVTVTAASGTTTNNPPVAADDAATTNQDTPLTVQVLANDSDPDGDTLSVTSTSTPTNGTATINANNTITYSPNQSFSGTDSFTYTISDGNGGTDTATVAMTVSAVQPQPPSTVTLTVKSADMAGNTFEGMWVELFQNGQVIQTGFTPFSVVLDSGIQYVVDVANFENNIFDHWDDGSTTPARAFSTSQNSTFTAFYQTSTAP